MKNYVCGIDIGTTGVKVMVFDPEGTIKASAYTEYDCFFPKSGWVEQDGEMTWKKMCETVKKALSRSNLDPKDIRAIALSTQRCTITPIDDKGRPLHLAISWQDTRSFEEVEDIKKIIGEKNFYNRIGYPLGTVLSVTEILWLKKNKPDIYDRTYKFVTDQERILHKMGVEWFYQDWANGSLFGLMDIETFEWDIELTKMLGIDPEKLPSLVPSGKVLGKVSAEGASLTGFAQGTLLISGAGDQQCAGIGTGTIRNGVIEVTLGTAGVTLGYMDTPKKDASMGLSCSAHAIPGVWESEGVQNAAASSFKWFRNQFAFPEAQLAQETGQDVYDVIDKEIEKVEPGCNGLICIPYLAGQSAPHWDPFARGTFIGFNLGHTRADMARAIMEGVTYEAREIIDGMIENGLSVEEIVLSGGGAKAPVWCQIQADVYGKPCIALENEDATVLGAAVLAAVGAGLYDSIEQAVSKMIRRKSTYQPNMAVHERYNQFFEIYKKAYKALHQAGVYEELVKLALGKD